MSPSNSRSHETSRRRSSAIGEASESPKETANGILPNKKERTEHAELSSATSRYGRTIKAKSPKIPEGDSPKTGKIPKLRKSTTLSPLVTEKSNGFIKKEKEIVEAENETIVEIPVKSEKDSPKKKESECKFVLGQLAWAHVGNYPYWPCVITPDPESQLYTKIKICGKGRCLVVHVQYFGDKGRHGWVFDTAMIPFTGMTNFQKLAKANADVKTKYHPKGKKTSTGFVVRPKISVKWEIAIEEATAVMAMTNEQRTEYFKPDEIDTKYKKSVERDSIGKTNGKRERLSDHGGPNPKRIKRENTSMTEDPEYEPIKKKSQKSATDVEVKMSINLNTETPPTPPSSHKDSSDESSVVKKTKIKKRKKDIDGDFELYYERNRDMIEDTQPDATEEEIRTYLQKTWENMNLTLRSKYRSRIKTVNSSQSKEGSPDQEDEVDSDSKYTKKNRKSSTVKVEKEEPRVSDITKKSRPHNLFRGFKQEKVCQICERTGDLTRCKGPCFSYFHLSCVKPGESSSEYSADEETSEADIFEDSKDNTTINDDDEKIDDVLDDETFKCIDCLSGVAPACFICNEREDDRVRCGVIACGRHYHPQCLKAWPQTHWQGDRLTCPYHMCHTCISDNPQTGHSRTSTERVVRCVRCPSSYHVSTACLPAGSEILTGSHVICPKHYKAPGPPLNATWCFLCTSGGSLICCDTCPTSFHLECLGIKAPDGAFICEDCETGRLPLYGEVVWVKLGNYRWWPSRICFPFEVPRNLEAISHRPGEFCVMFLGTNNYYWVHKGRAFLYQDGDANVKVSLRRKNVDEAYRKAMEEANDIHLRLKSERVARGSESRSLKPPHYVKLKINKPVGNVKSAEVDSIVACECDAKKESPCAPDSDCLNRILSVECSPDICPAGPKCNNQAFVRREYPAMEPFHTVGRGWGLKTLESLTSGQFVIEYVGEVIDEAEYKRRLHHKKELKNENFYFLTIDTNRMIDAEPKGNLSRFMNHSCQPNCETQKWTVNGDTRVGLFTLRDVEANEELTFNYNLACDGETRKPCLCGAPNCSGFIGLKAQKQHPKIEKVKPQKRSKKASLNAKQMCWTCGEELADSDDALTCDQKTCFKKYHENCVTVEDKDTKFSCPWHRCKECSRRTGAHCNFCSTAYCQAHLEGNLTEYKDKGYICKVHEEMDARKLSSGEEDKEDSENDVENEKDSSSISSNSSLVTEKSSLPRVSSPRVSIVEVQFSSEEGEESQKEDSSNLEESFLSDKKKNRNTKMKKTERIPHRRKQREESIKTIRSLTPSQLEIIIGGRITKYP